MAMIKVIILSLLLVQVKNAFGQGDGASGDAVVSSVANLVKSLMANSSRIQQAMDIMKEPTAFLANLTSTGRFQATMSKIDSITDGVSGSCLAHLAMLAKALYQRDHWALSMIDAFGKPPAGLMRYKLLWMGDWDECINTVAAINSTVTGIVMNPFSGKYCPISFPVKIEINLQKVALTIGTCVPDSCSSKDIQALARLVFGLLPKAVAQFLNEPVVECKEKELMLDGTAITVIAVCSVFVAIITLATVYDAIYVQWLSTKSASPPVAENNQTGVEAGLKSQEVYTVETNKYEEGEIPPNGLQSNCIAPVDASNGNTQQTKTTYTPGMLEAVLLSFSAFTNGTKLLSTRQPKGALTAINGIRFLSMTWVIIGHSFVRVLSPPTDNSANYVRSLIKRREFQAIMNGTFSVDTFFVLSGLLVSYLSLKEMKKVKGVKGFKWVMFYFHRFWRLTPPYMLLLMVWVSLDKYMATGPLWSQDGMATEQCKSDWWINLLYINNLVKGKEMIPCFGWTWYLANDMQFYILSPLLIIPLYYSPILGGLACLVGLAASATASGLISMHYKLPSSGLFALGQGDDYSWQYYVKPWCRVGPYIVGIFTGYLLYRTDRKIMINRIVNVIVWIVVTVVGCLIIYGLYSEHLKDPLTLQQAALYNATSRSVWGACVAWVIFACARGYGGPISHFLSWSAFVPLGRLTYFAYLVHIPLMGIYNQSAVSTVTAYDYAVVYQILGHIVVAYTAAFVLSLSFEAPMMGLEKTLMGRGKHN